MNFCKQAARQQQSSAAWHSKWHSSSSIHPKVPCNYCGQQECIWPKTSLKSILYACQGLKRQEAACYSSHTFIATLRAASAIQFSVSAPWLYMQWFQINFQRYKRPLLFDTWQHLDTCCFIAIHSTAGRHVKQVIQFSSPGPNTQININNELAARLAIWVHTLGRLVSCLCSCS